MNSVEIKHITKNFGKVCALNDVTLLLEENKIYGLLGRNGAGKSTLLNIITNRIFADSGDMLVDGESIIDNDNALGKLFLVNEKNFYPDKMKLSEIFEWTKSFYPDFDIEYANSLSEKFRLNTNKHFKSLSTGYASIFRLILALSVNTPYLFLDEPVLGLDANHRELFYRLLIQKYSERPCTIIISTHLIEEISGVIEHIIIINDGKIIRNESTEKLLSLGYTISGNAPAIDSYIIGKQVLGTESLGGLKTAYILGSRENNIPNGLEISTLDLQKLFIQLTNNGEEI
jgi:ABC-type multidrug transport system, ATPase component